MEIYKSKSGKLSGVTGFIIGPDFIAVEFNNAEVYTYTYKSCGKLMVEEMKELAMANLGLSTYISRKVPAYENLY